MEIKGSHLLLCSYGKAEPGEKRVTRCRLRREEYPDEVRWKFGCVSGFSCKRAYLHEVIIVRIDLLRYIGIFRLILSVLHSIDLLAKQHFG